MPAQPGSQPVGPAFEVFREILQRYSGFPAAKLVLDTVRVPGKQRPFRIGIVVKVRFGVEQREQLLEDLGGLCAGAAGECADQAGQFPQIPRVGAGKGHAFAVLGGHVERVVPVGAPQAVEVMGAHLVKCGELLDEQMLQNGAGIHAAVRRVLPGALFGPVRFIDCGAAQGLGVLKIGCLPV